ncbi:hypothetical protein ATW87_11150 [Oenococcus oeni]|nr:hypothetical protein ATW87_11150 [Oenococcus oeni]
MPIVIPADVTTESVLDDNKTYQAVWDVLRALRSTDERFNAMVNKLQLNNRKPDNLDIIGFFVIQLQFINHGVKTLIGGSQRA